MPRISRLNLDQLNTLSCGQRSPKCTLAASPNQSVGRFFVMMCSSILFEGLKGVNRRFSLQKLTPAVDKPSGLALIPASALPTCTIVLWKLQDRETLGNAEIRTLR